jgi:hypothetical protein
VNIQGGNVVFAKKSKQYLKDAQELLQNQFNIDAVQGREIVGLGKTYTLVINKRENIEKLSRIGTLAERKSQLLRKIVVWYKNYEKNSALYLARVKQILSTPHTIGEICNMTSIPYFILKNRIIRRLNPKIVAKQPTKSSRVANVYLL